MSSKKPLIDVNDVRFYSGRSNPVLAKKIADYLGVPLDETHYSKFSNDNLFIQLGASVRGRVVLPGAIADAAGQRSFAQPADDVRYCQKRRGL
ncbi:MAG: ribose-phosphate pyrophosphokinase-like domain-containing protein [Chloroflexi bacterium]|nr:ribose-phosphate pyrophosphokinase-like domain-containing protein [Chloroflexota bacterium]